MRTVRVLGASLAGTSAELVTVEARFDARDREKTDVVLTGLPDSVLRESRGKLVGALAACGFRVAPGRLYLNLVPAARRKSGESLDLPLLLGAIAATGHLEPRAVRGVLFLGEVGIDGTLHAVPGGLPAALAAREAGVTTLVAPVATAAEAGCLPQVTAHGAAHVAQVVAHLAGGTPLPATRDASASPRAGPGDGRRAAPPGAPDRARAALELGATISARGDERPGGSSLPAGPRSSTRPGGPAEPAPPTGPAGGGRARVGRPDGLPARAAPRGGTDDPLDRVRGCDEAKLALAVAAAGGHGLLLVGPPGAGKSLLARALPSLLPPPSLEDRIAITCVLSAIGRWPGGLATERPFRAPHHTTSYAGLVGGGSPPAPGEITLAHGGVLFLDELPEFRRDALEALRQPLETGVAVVARAGRRVEFPARFQLAAAMNPCPCGHRGDERVPCRCPPARVEAYRRRVSGPLLDRVDLRVELRPPDLDDLVPRGRPRAPVPRDPADRASEDPAPGGPAPARRATGHRTADDRAAGGRAPGRLAADPAAFDRGASGNRAAQHRPPEHRAPEHRASASRASGRGASGNAGRRARGGTGGDALRAAVSAARERMVARQGERPNALLEGGELDRWVPLRGRARQLVQEAVRRRGLSARAVQSLRRVARTLADLDGSGPVSAEHAARALALRAPLEPP